MATTSALGRSLAVGVMGQVGVGMVAGWTWGVADETGGGGGGAGGGL